MPDGSYPVSDIKDYIKYIMKKHETLSANPLIHIYINRINNRLVFRVKDNISQNYKLLKVRSYLVAQKKLIDKTKNGENVPSLKVV